MVLGAEHLSSVHQAPNFKLQNPKEQFESQEM